MPRDANDFTESHPGRGALCARKLDWMALWKRGPGPSPVRAVEQRTGHRRMLPPATRPPSNPRPRQQAAPVGGGPHDLPHRPSSRPASTASVTNRSDSTAAAPRMGKVEQLTAYCASSAPEIFRRSRHQSMVGGSLPRPAIPADLKEVSGFSKSASTSFSMSAVGTRSTCACHTTNQDCEPPPVH